MLKTDEGTYFWTYALDMKKNMSLFRLVFKIIGITTGIPLGFLILLEARDFISYRYIDWHWVKTVALISAGIIATMAVITFLAYKFISWRYHGNYFMLFKMNEEGINFTQVEDQQKQNELIGLTSMAVGMATGNYGLVGTGLAVSENNSLYTRFDKVRKIKIRRVDNLIGLRTFITYNMIYVDDDNYEFVLEFIKSRCKKAKIR